MYNQSIYTMKDCLQEPLVYMSRELFDSIIEEQARSKAKDLVREKHSQSVEDEAYRYPYRLISKKALIKMLDVDESTLNRWDKSGVLPCMRINKKKVVYSYEDVLKAAKKGEPK